MRNTALDRYLSARLKELILIVSVGCWFVGCGTHNPLRLVNVTETPTTIPYEKAEFRISGRYVYNRLSAAKREHVERYKQSADYSVVRSSDSRKHIANVFSKIGRSQIQQSAAYTDPSSK